MEERKEGRGRTEGSGKRGKKTGGRGAQLSTSPHAGGAPGQSDETSRSSVSGRWGRQT